MKIVYIASGIPVPGALGGSTHTLEVARGLAARGHELHVVACSQEGHLQLADLTRPHSIRYEGFFLHHLDVPKSMALLCLPVIQRLIKAVSPDAVMERYYNFAGCGLIAAQRLAIPTLLEVNALIIDPPEVRKRRIDDRLGGPMRRWAIAQCQMASRIVTPLHTTVPAEIPRNKIIELPWGAAVERFMVGEQGSRGAGEQGSRGAGEQGNRGTGEQGNRGTGEQGSTTVVFLGSFRAWHGVLDFVHAAGRVIETGRKVQFMLIGDGPLRQEAENLASRWPGRFTFTGAVAYEQVPELLQQATIGVAPFNRASHPALRSAGFFWSPLKIYEYMAASLPVITANIPPLDTVIRDSVEGLLFHEGDIANLASAITRLLDDPQAAQMMGQRGRERVIAQYSWAQHCAALEGIINAIVG